MRPNTLAGSVAFLVGLAVLVAADRTHGLPTKPESKTILPGVGLTECRMGGPIADARALFGNPSKAEGRYVQFTDQGVEVIVRDDKIQGMFFIYRQRVYKPFVGKTDTGIGPDSTMEDVQKAYGKPDRIDESVISEFGSNPGALEHVLTYDKLRIAFTFHNRKLAIVRVWAAKE